MLINATTLKNSKAHDYTACKVCRLRSNIAADSGVAELLGQNHNLHRVCSQFDIPSAEPRKSGEDAVSLSFFHFCLPQLQCRFTFLKLCYHASLYTDGHNISRHNSSILSETAERAITRLPGLLKLALRAVPLGEQRLPVMRSRSSSVSAFLANRVSLEFRC
jgi:hypothetical protein